jgi:hypothetical protein
MAIFRAPYGKVFEIAAKAASICASVVMVPALMLVTVLLSQVKQD